MPTVMPLEEGCRTQIVIVACPIDIGPEIARIVGGGVTGQIFTTGNSWRGETEIETDQQVFALVKQPISDILSRPNPVGWRD